VWQAQLAGVLPRDPMLQRDDLAPEARDTLRLIKANALLRRLASTFVAAPAGERPAVSVVLLGPVLWTRFVPGDGIVDSIFHVAGPERTDVVLVTDAAVLEAIADGQLTLASALDLRLARLYGTPEAIAHARRWLGAGA
jgi:predicted ATPase